jgi:hypothetical protein
MTTGEASGAPIVSEPQSERSAQTATDLFSWGALAGLTGASTAVTVITGTLSAAFSWKYPTWVPFGVAFVIVASADVTLMRDRRAARMNRIRPVLWLLNTCLVFTTAVGGAHLATARPEPSVRDDGTRRVSEPAPPELAERAISGAPPSAEPASRALPIEAAVPDTADVPTSASAASGADPESRMAATSERPKPSGPATLSKEHVALLPHRLAPPGAVLRQPRARLTQEAEHSLLEPAVAAEPIENESLPAKALAPDKSGFKRLGEVSLF